MFCFNDELAVRAIRDLIEAGHRVPEDVAVIGIDDVDLCQVTRPRVSTIAPDKEAIAERAVTMLLGRIGGDTVPPRLVTAGFSLGARESTQTGVQLEEQLLDVLVATEDRSEPRKAYW